MAISMEELRQQFYENLKKADSSEAFEQLRIRYLGKKGEITGLLKNMGQLAAFLRMKVDNFVPAQFNQVKGQPFVVSELVDNFTHLLEA